MIIRPEREQDIDAITAITVEAFKTMEISPHTEQFIIHALRKSGNLALSLVAEKDGQVVGHIAFSPVTVADGSQGWYGVGPLSVSPEFQKQGIGTALMKKGLSLLKEMNGKGCLLVGDPKYYIRFNFKNIPDLILEGVPQQVF